jgi:capsular exopolysaccharide synthesis family protein
MEESLRGLRVKIKKILEEKNGKSVLITSTISGEGKTATAVNLAKILVRDGQKVLLVDCDFRKQGICEALEQEQTEKGLLACLEDTKLDPRGLIRQVDGLDFLSGGRTEKRNYHVPAQQVRSLLDALAVDYDYVIVDAPPCEAVSDAATLARCTDCVIYMVKQEYVRRDQLVNAVTALHHKDIAIDGCVFNGAPHSGRRYGYGYGYGYGYNYGYGYGYGYGYKKYGYGYSKYAKQKKEAAEEE